MILPLLLLFSFVAVPLAFFVAKYLRSTLLALVPAVLFLGFASLGLEVIQQGELTQQVSWVPSLGISLSLRLDGLALIFALLITGIGTAIFLYASAYLPSNWQTPRFFVTLTVFMSSMLGAVLADDLFGLIVFWELTSLASFMLIGYDPSQAQSRRSAQQGLLITVAGGLAMMAGIILLGAHSGTYVFSEILENNISSDFTQPLGTWILCLIAIGAFAKSAQFPLHSWLANAMVAPTPVSAYLHSATMVKLGVYLLARLSPVLSENALWTPMLVGVGSITMLAGLVLALRETDLKRILAYTTIVSLGTLITMLGLNHPIAITATVVFLVVHALYKACLFMVAGIIDQQTGTRDSSILGGLAKSMPITAIVACLAAFSMAGLPPLFGFIGKELLYEATLSTSTPLVTLLILVLANATMVVVAAIIVLRCFFGKVRQETKALNIMPHDPAVSMWIGPLVLAVLSLVLGLVPEKAQDLFSLAASSIAGRTLEVELSLWHGLTPMLGLSVLTFMVGIGLYLAWTSISKKLSSCKILDNWGPDAIYDRALDGLVAFSSWQTRHIQTGSLRHYMAMSVGFVTFLTLSSLWLNDGLVAPSFQLEDLGRVLVLPLLLIGTSIMVLRSQGFVQGIISAGTVGFIVAVVFLLDGAPDLAFTQFSIEALSVVILLAVVGHMPFQKTDPRETKQKIRDAVIAVFFGIMFIVMLFSVLDQPFNEMLSDFFREASYPLAQGRNLVNVIIVDFRALDTLGEIAVLALAAIAAVAVFYSSGEEKILKVKQNKDSSGGTSV